MKSQLKFNRVLEENINYDFETLQRFIVENHFSNGRNLDWAVFQPHSWLESYRLKNGINLSEETVRNYIAREHRKYSYYLAKTFSFYQKSWEKVSKGYFFLVHKLFPENYWPEGKYIAYPTIWGMYPRRIEDSTFSLPFSGKNVNTIIAHELLHFIFYNYMQKHYFEYMELDNCLFVWHVSEIFNVLLQNSQRWLKVFGRENPVYPKHEEIVAKLSDNKILLRYLDLNAIIDMIINQVEIKFYN